MGTKKEGSKTKKKEKVEKIIKEEDKPNIDDQKECLQNQTNDSQNSSDLEYNKLEHFPEYFQNLFRESKSSGIMYSGILKEIAEINEVDSKIVNKFIEFINENEIKIQEVEECDNELNEQVKDEDNSTNFVKMYFNEISKHSLLSKKEEVRLAVTSKINELKTLKYLLFFPVVLKKLKLLFDHIISGKILVQEVLSNKDDADEKDNPGKGGSRYGITDEFIDMIASLKKRKNLTKDNKKHIFLTEEFIKNFESFIDLSNEYLEVLEQYYKSSKNLDLDYCINYFGPYINKLIKHFTQLQLNIKIDYFINLIKSSLNKGKYAHNRIINNNADEEDHKTLNDLSDVLGVCYKFATVVFFEIRAYNKIIQVSYTKLICANLRLMVRLAQHHVVKCDLLSAMNHSCLGLIKAVEKYSTTKKKELTDDEFDSKENDPNLLMDKS